jgi:hypothetical protein
MAKTIIIRPGDRLVITSNDTPSGSVIQVGVERGPLDEATTPMPQPGRTGYTRDQFAWLAEQYRQAERDDPRAPVHLLARRIGRHPVTTGRMLTRARKLGLLTDSGP